MTYDPERIQSTGRLLSLDNRDFDVIGNPEIIKQELTKLMNFKPSENNCDRLGKARNLMWIVTVCGIGQIKQEVLSKAEFQTAAIGKVIR